MIAECHQTAKDRKPAPEQQVEDWAREVEKYLFAEDSLGDSYVARFRNSAGLPLGMTTLMPPYSHVEGYLKTRNARLSEFIQEVS